MVAVAYAQMKTLARKKDLVKEEGGVQVQALVLEENLNDVNKRDRAYLCLPYAIVMGGARALKTRHATSSCPST